MSVKKMVNIKNPLLIFPFHTFLLGPTLIFFLFVHNYEELYSDSIFRSLFITFGITILVYLINFFLLKKHSYKAAVFSSSILLIFFSYGIIYDFFEHLYYKKLWPFANIHRYLILSFSLLIILFFFLIKRTVRSFHTLSHSLNVFVGFILLFNIIILSIKAANIRKKEDAGSSIQYLSTQNTDSFPDIYYIILDGYANDRILSVFYNYSRNTLTDFFRQKNFYVAEKSKTNYISTSTSLASSLNFSYLDSLMPAERTNLIYKNKVCQYLKSKGYNIVHLRSGYSVTRENFYADVIIPLDALNEFERTLLKYTIFRLDDLIGYTHYITIKEQLKKIYSIIPIEGPKFIFIHIVSPHPPYICDETGKFSPINKLKDVWWEPKGSYLAQLKFINRKIIKYIDSILNKSHRKVIIIVQSDHGPFITDGSFENIYEARSRILNSFYIPFSFRKKLYSNITPVNTFRIIFNGLFQDSLPLSTDIPVDSSSLKNMSEIKNYYKESLKE